MIMKIFGKEIPAPTCVLSLLGVFTLLGLVTLWWARDPGRSGAGILAAVLCAALFAVVGVRFVVRWMEDWRSRRSETYRERLREPIRAVTLVKIFSAVLGGELAALGLFWLLRLLEEGWMSFSDAMSLWTHLDVQHYLNIARDGYVSAGDMSRVVELVFLPGFPLAVRLFASVTGNYLLAGIFVSLLSIAGAGVMLYCLARLDTAHGGALPARAQRGRGGFRGGRADRRAVSAGGAEPGAEFPGQPESAGAERAGEPAAAGGGGRNIPQMAGRILKRSRMRLHPGSVFRLSLRRPGRC